MTFVFLFCYNKGVFFFFLNWALIIINLDILLVTLTSEQEQQVYK